MNGHRNLMLARVFMAEQHNTGAKIGLAYRDRGRVHVHKLTIGKFEDFARLQDTYMAGNTDLGSFHAQKGYLPLRSSLSVPVVSLEPAMS